MSSLVLTNNKPHQKKSASTLLEIIISMTIFALVVTGLASLFVATRTKLFHFRHRMVAGQLGSIFLDPLSQDVRFDEWTPNANCLQGDDSSCPGTQNLNNTDYTPTYTRTGLLGGNIIKVRLRLSWQEIVP